VKRIAVLESFSHHNIHASPDNAINYLNYDLVIKPKTETGPTRRPNIITRKANTFLRRLSGMSGYGVRGLLTELDIYKKSYREKNLIHYFNGDTNCKLLPYVKGDNIVIATYHQPPDVFNKVFAKPSHINKLDAAIVTSPILIDNLSKHIDRKRIFFVPLAIDTDVYTPVHAPRPQGQRTCLFAGNWLRDFETMRKVVEQLENDRHIKFKIITFESNWRIFEGLKNVELLSKLTFEDYLETFRNASLMVIPFTDCTSNLAILEAMACGLPIITTDVGGIRDYVSTSFTILNRKGDDKAMAHAIVDLIDNEDQLEIMSRNSRNHAKKFDWKVVSNTLNSVYETVET
jgi:glycosyltransferase involved in cell wall biosynthesis